MRNLNYKINPITNLCRYKTTLHTHIHTYVLSKKVGTPHVDSPQDTNSGFRSSYKTKKLL